MSEMIERVARAIEAAAAKVGAFYDVSDIEVASMARAAIEAMRQPTEPIIKAINDYVDERGKARAIWADAIDAALEESK